MTTAKGCATIYGVKLFAELFGNKKEKSVQFDQSKAKTIADYQRELLVKMGKQQFERLNELGLGISLGFHK